MQTKDRTINHDSIRANQDQGAALSVLYFAYGSNLNQEQMLVRCPAASPVGRLTLPDWQLEFRGVADIVPCPGAEVVGALYRIWPQDEQALDRYEGYRRSDPERGLYRKVYYKRQYTEGRIARFMFYVMNDGALWPPQSYYLQTIRQGYADWGLPVDTLDAAVRRSQSSEGRWDSEQTESEDFLNEDFLTGDLFGEEFKDV